MTEYSLDAVVTFNLKIELKNKTIINIRKCSCFRYQDKHGRKHLKPILLLCIFLLVQYYLEFYKI